MMGPASTRPSPLLLAPDEAGALLGTGGKSMTPLPRCPPLPLPSLPVDAPWTVLLASVDPEATSVMVKGLVPARSYQFRLCAVNDVGKGQFSKDTER